MVGGRRGEGTGDYQSSLTQDYSQERSHPGRVVIEKRAGGAKVGLNEN